LDALPPPPPPTVQYAQSAPGDIYARGTREAELCDTASRPDWLYLGGLVVLDAGAIWAGSSDAVKASSSIPVRAVLGPGVIGLTWGATLGGAWLALPKCSRTWVESPPPDGQVRVQWPLALSLALLAGVTAPVVNGIAIGFDLPVAWSTVEREMHLVVAGVAGFAGAFVPYLLPPSTWTAAQELERIRFSADSHSAFIGYGHSF
jgi:hypothetical protein